MTEIPTNNNNKDSSEDQKLDDTKQLVNNLFKKINDKQSLPGFVKSILQKLSSSYLKIAMDTPNLFAFENHQARVFLDNACRISIDWTELEDNNNSFIKKLETTVEKINNLERYNNKDFVQFQADLEKFLVKLNKRAAIKQKREQEKLLGQQKISQAKEETANLISQKVSNTSNLPEFIEHILLEEWSNVLVLLHIRNTPDSHEYKSKLDFIDLVVELSLKHKALDDAKKQYQTLLRKYQDGLTLVAFNKQEIKDKQNELLQFLKNINQTPKVEETINPEDIIKMSQHQQKEPLKAIKIDLTENSDLKITPEQKEHQPVETIESIEIISTENESNQSSVSSTDGFIEMPDELEKKQQPVKYESINVKEEVNTPNESKVEEDSTEGKIDFAEVVTSLEIGTWFEISEADGNSIKAKLSWKSPISGNHLFVDTQGLKIANKSRSQLIEGLTDNTIKIIKAY